MLNRTSIQLAAPIAERYPCGKYFYLLSPKLGLTLIEPLQRAVCLFSKASTPPLYSPNSLKIYVHNDNRLSVLDPFGSDSTTGNGEGSKQIKIEKQMVRQCWQLIGDVQYDRNQKKKQLISVWIGEWLTTVLENKHMFIGKYAATISNLLYQLSGYYVAHSRLSHPMNLSTKSIVQMLLVDSWVAVESYIFSIIIRRGSTYVVMASLP